MSSADIQLFNLKETIIIIIELKNFYGVADLEYIPNVNMAFPYYEGHHQQPQFRKSTDKEVCEYSMASWIRKGEIEATKIQTEPFSKQRMEELISEMKKLSLVNSSENIAKLK